MVEQNYPSNSRTTRGESDGPKKDPSEKKVEKVISGDAVVRPPSLWKRFSRTFVGGDDATSVGQYLLNEVVVPAFKDTVTDMVSQGIERLVYGEVRGRSAGVGRSLLRGPGGPSHVAYNRMSQNGPASRMADPRQELSHQARASHNFAELVIPSRVDADSVIQGLYELVSNFDVATVADLYELAGTTSHFTDAKWGWYDLRGTRAERVKGGYLLNLPRPVPIE